jgi:uncharacterized protein (TIGR02996 family)
VTEEDALLARIREEPDGDEPRLVYADWLQQRGDSYGEMIALGIELDRCCDDARSKELRARIEALPCHADWTARLGTTPVLRRGMPAFALLLQEMLVPELVQRVRGSYVRSLHVKCDGLEDHQVACLRDALEYMAVRELTTWYCPAGDVGAILAGCDTVERITINGATNAHLEMLASARLPKLVAVSTGYSSAIDDSGAITLGTIETLRELDLPRGRIGPAGIGRILDRIAPEKLVVSHNPIGDLGVIRICRTLGLRELEIDGTDYTEAAIEVLAESEELAASLQKLVLGSDDSGRSNLTPRGLRLLIESHLSRDLELGIDGYALGLEARVQTRFDYAEDTYIAWLTEPSGEITERFKISVGMPAQGSLES